MASIEAWMKFAVEEFEPLENHIAYEPIDFEQRMQSISASLDRDNVKEVHAKLPEHLKLEFP